MLERCKVEPALADTAPGEVVQFERIGYFAADPDQPLLFHRTVGLRDEWANIQKRTVTPAKSPVRDAERHERAPFRGSRIVPGTSVTSDGSVDVVVAAVLLGVAPRDAVAGLEGLPVGELHLVEADGHDSEPITIERCNGFQQPL